MTIDSGNLQLAVCAYCGGTGWEPVEGKGVRPCNCRINERREQMLAAANIPKRYQKCSFDNYLPNGGPTSVNFLSQAYALRDAKHLVDEFPNIEIGPEYKPPMRGRKRRQGLCGSARVVTAWPGPRANFARAECPTLIT